MGRDKPNMTVARIEQYGTAKIGACERHDERKNESYGNVNVDVDRIPMNVHFKDPCYESYMDILRRLENEGAVSTRGLRKDAKLFDELILDVNTNYFEENGGYKFAVKFYREAYRFAEKIYGKENILSAVLHADEINKSATEEYGYPVYHYHLHVIALPVVDKEIRWSKRCKDPALRGTVKEVIHQISHSKKWASTKPMVDMDGNPMYRKNGKPMFIPSYSILQDDFFEHMTSHGFRDFERGEFGSTAEHMSSIDYQTMIEQERLADIFATVESAEIEYAPALEVQETVEAINAMGTRTITGTVRLKRDDFKKLTSLAKEGITSRTEIRSLNDRIEQLSGLYHTATEKLRDLQAKYDQLKEKCKVFLEAIEHFPDVVRDFRTKVRELFTQKDAQERQAQEEAERRQQEARAEAERKRREAFAARRGTKNRWTYPDRDAR